MIVVGVVLAACFVLRAIWEVIDFYRYRSLDRAIDDLNDRHRRMMLEMAAALVAAIDVQNRRRKQDWSPREDPALWK